MSRCKNGSSPGQNCPMCPYVVSGFLIFRNPVTMCGHGNRVTSQRNRRFPKQNGPFVARSRSSISTNTRSSPNYMISTNVKDIRRNWAKIGPFFPKIRGHFYGFRRSKSAFYRSGMGNVAWVRSTTGGRQAWTTSRQFRLFRIFRLFRLFRLFR